MKRIVSALFILSLISTASLAQSTLSKYGNDFLSTGAGARALGMGGTHTSLANDVTAGYWNVAGLSSLSNPEVIYMHSERFGGIVGYDYGAAALPLSSGNGVVGISFFRQGVDNIANTLNAWDNERGDNGGPKADPESFITKFSAADVAIFLSYAKKHSDKLSYGASAKIINQRLGPFANAWGYSLDVGAQYKTDFIDLGASIQDVTTMQKMWTVNEGEFEGFQETFSDSIPTGQNEYVLPSVRLGASKAFKAFDFDFIAAADLNLLFENRRAYYMNIGSMSIEPHVGGEVIYKNRISARAGLTDFVTDPESGFSVSPTLGLGFRVATFYIDYGFASFTGTSSSLGYTHRISLKFNLKGKG
tara:strand:+ start:27748 stop:28830 length:1083 start_codon:yes stop_codon:yes gene_type:complete